MCGVLGISPWHRTGPRAVNHWVMCSTELRLFNTSYPKSLLKSISFV